MSDCDSDCEETEVLDEKLNDADITVGIEQINSVPLVVADEKEIISAFSEYEDKFGVCSNDDDDDEHVESAADPTSIFLTSFLVYKKLNRWPAGSKLKVKFLGATYYYLLPKTIKMLTDLLNETQNGACVFWNQVCNINFEIVDSGDADIRIAFKADKIFNSKVGMTGCKAVVDQSLPTMSLGFENDNWPKPEIYRKLLHEFGHALGFYHEHQNPKRTFSFDLAAVQAAHPTLTIDQIRQNIIDIIKVDPNSVDVLYTSAFDVSSIMAYGFRKEELVGYKNKEIFAMLILSMTDCQKALEAYPY